MPKIEWGSETAAVAGGNRDRHHKLGNTRIEVCTLIRELSVTSGKR